MAQITISEISQNYAYNVDSASYATVAMPITSCWGPGYVDPATVGKEKDVVLEETVWQRFPSTREGIESFVATYRGPEDVYRSAKDNSYQMALTLLSTGYDVLVCRVCPGATAEGKLQQALGDSKKELVVKAKYPGSFGNNLDVTIRKVSGGYGDSRYNYWNVITYIINTDNSRVAAENIVFVFDIDKSTDNLPHISEVQSDFLTFVAGEELSDDAEFASSSSGSANSVRLSGGSDTAKYSDAATALEAAYGSALYRYTKEGLKESNQYLTALKSAASTITDTTRASVIAAREWTFSAAYDVLELLTDKLSYSPNRVIASGWDDQELSFISDEELLPDMDLSPLHTRLMYVAYYSRCATAYIDVPKDLPRGNVSKTESDEGYAQKLSAYIPEVAVQDVNNPLFSTHSALFAPWGQYTYTGTSKMQEASPAFLALMIDRAMITNQAIQYEWALPTNRKQNLNIGKLVYTVTKKYLDEWQSLEGVGVNAIATIPDLGTSLWGNSTLYNVPPATYQALANLSTRKLVNAIEDRCYRAGIAITFQYNNDQAYSSFYAALTPLLDTMRNVGAIEDYRIEMSADINGTDRVNANTVIGKIWLSVYGIINNISIDLVCLPPGTDLSNYSL